MAFVLLPAMITNAFTLPPSRQHLRVGGAIILGLTVFALALVVTLTFAATDDVAQRPPTADIMPGNLDTDEPLAPGPFSQAEPDPTPPEPDPAGTEATEADGVLPSPVNVFADEYPAVANLDPALLQAVRAAADDAANDGVQFAVTSGWRSATYQQQLMDEAIEEHGSKREARRWVATAETSAHVSGDAVDIGPDDARTWLSAHGATYGLCQTYANEPWHFELRPDAAHDDCPAMYDDPSEDPRLQP